MKALQTLTTIFVITSLCTACQREHKGSASQIGKTDTGQTQKINTLSESKFAHEKVSFFDPIILKVGNDFKVQLLNTEFTTDPTTPSLDNILKNYLLTCYQDYHQLPRKIIIIYPSSRIKLIGHRQLEEAVMTALEAVRNHVPGSIAQQKIKYPILYQTKF